MQIHKLVCVLLVLCLVFGAKKKSKGKSDEVFVSQTMQRASEAMRQKMDYATAINLYKQVVEVSPKNSQALGDLGLAYYYNGQHVLGVESLKKAIKNEKNKKQESQWWNNLAVLYSEMNDLDETAKTLKKSLAISPSDLTLTNLVRLLQGICSWDEWDSLMSKISKYVERQSRTPASEALLLPPQHALFYPIAPDLVRDCAASAVRRTQYLLAQDGVVPFRHVGQAFDGGARLRVGYISMQFHENSLGRLMQSAFALHSKHRFEVVAYCTAADSEGGSQVRRKMKESGVNVIEFHELPVPNKAGAINSHNLHILVDLDGHTLGGRHAKMVGVSDIGAIMSTQPAPVQLSYLGFCGSMGAPYIQYFVGDTTTSPPEYASHYTEKIIHLPVTYQFNSVRDTASAAYIQEINAERGTPTRAEFGIPEDVFVFTHFNDVYKIDPKIFASWMRILKRVPASVLVLFCDSPPAYENLMKTCRKAKIDPSRIVRIDRVGIKDHLRRLQLFDLFLDAYVVHAHTTATDALWAGIPLVSIAGERFANRVSVGLNLANNMTHTAARTFGEYEDIAVHIASNAAKYSVVKQRLLASKEHPTGLFASSARIREWERALFVMWELHLQSSSAHVKLVL